MKPFETVWRELLSRRLLPVAILLLAALVATPLLLAKDPEPAAAPPQPAKPATATAATADPIVTLVEDGDRTKRRRVLGARKDPFAPAPVKPVKTPAPTTVHSAPAQSAPSLPSPPKITVPSGGGTSVRVGGTSMPSAGAPPAVSPAPATPPAPKRRYELYSLVVRFGDTTSDTLDRMTLPRLKPLPSAENPILVYMGVTKDEKGAIFMVDSSVQAQGDGVCRPSTADCDTIELREGETEFLDVLDEKGETTDQFELDLVKIRRSTTSSAAKAAAFRAKVSQAGRKIMRARRAAEGPLRYHYDPKSGTVRRLGAKAWKAAIARASW